MKDNSVFYRVYDKKKLYEYYKLYNQNQGSLGTNFIKSKYEIESLTQEDMDYLKNQNIKCYSINIPYENRYIFTSYNKLVSYIERRYKKEDFFKFMKFGEVNHLKKQFHREYITVLDLIKLKAKEFNLNKGE